MTTQPEALRLADELEEYVDGAVAMTAAAELRRLHAENETLRAANEAFGKRQEWWNERMVILEQQRDALLAMLRESLRNAEWWDKHIHPVDGEAFQNWKLSIYLPVKISEIDKSPSAALNRAIDAAIAKIKGEKK